MNDSPKCDAGSSKIELYRRFGGLAVGGTLGLLVPACGGASNEPLTPAAQVVVREEAPAPTPPPVVVAPEPPDVVVVGRVKTPGPTLTKLGEWAGFPLPWEDFLAQRLPRLAGVLNTSQSADFAVALDQESKGFPELHAVFSVALTDYDRGLSALRESGEVVASDEAQQVYVDVDEGVECTVARAKTQVRLVCGKHVALTTLGAFVATNLSEQQVGNSDLFAELRLAPIHARYGKRAQGLKVLVPALLREASLQNARFDAALAAAAHATVDDVLVLARELDALQLSMDLQDPAQQASVRVDVRFRGSESFLPAAVAHAAANVGPAPNSFWSLPAESSVVSFSTFAKPFARLPAAVDTLSELGAGALEHLGLASGAADRWLAEFKTLLNAGGATVFAHLPEAEHPPQNLGALVGVNVVGLEGDTGAAQRLLDASVTALNDKKLRAEIVKRTEGELPDLPTVTTKKTPASWGLPAGSKVYSVAVPKALASEYAQSQLLPQFAAKQGAFTLTLVAISQGERTWFGWGGSDAKVASALKSTLAPAGGAGLTTNPHLARWREARVNSGASFAVAQLFEPSSLGSQDLTTPAETELAIRSMPNGGTDFVHVKALATAEGPSTRLELEVPRAALQDLVSAFVSLASK